MIEWRGLPSLRAGAVGHVELQKCCKPGRGDEKHLGWSLRVVPWGSDECSKWSCYSFPILLSTCQWASKPRGANTVGKSLWLSQKQSLGMKLFFTGINTQAAVTEHLLADFVLEYPSVTLPRDHDFLMWKGTESHCGWDLDSGCWDSPELTWGAVACSPAWLSGGASSYSLKGQAEMRASVRPLCPVGQSHQADLECQWRPRNFWVFSGQISLSLTRKTDCLTNSWSVSLKATSQFSVTSWHGCNVFISTNLYLKLSRKAGRSTSLLVWGWGARLLLSDSGWTS